MPAPVNDECATATVINSLPYSDTLDVSDANDGPQGSCSVAPDPVKTVWWRWTAPDTDSIVITPTDSQDWGVYLIIWSGTCGTLVEEACEELWNESFVFTPAAGTTYYFELGTYDGVDLPESYTFQVRLQTPPDAPTIGATAPSSRNITITWGTLSDQNVTVHIERLISAVWTEIATTSGFNTFYYDRDLVGGQTYQHRVRVHSEYDGYSDYSNITTTSTMAGQEGVVQYAFAIGLTGSFSAAQEQLTNFGSSVVPIINIDALTPSLGGGIVNVYVEVNPTSTQPGGPGTDIFYHHKVLVGYRVGVLSTMTAAASGNVFDVMMLSIDMTGSQATAQDVDTVLEIRGRLGSCDTLTKTHRADGWFEIRVNGVIILTVSGVALGWQGTAGWQGLGIGPSGRYNNVVGTLTPPVDQNGGLSFMYVKSEDVYGAPGDIYDYDFSVLTDAQLFTQFNVANPWVRRDVSGSSILVPTLLDVNGATAGTLRLSNSSVGAVGTGWMRNSALLSIPELTGTSIGFDPDGEYYDFADYGEPPDISGVYYISTTTRDSYYDLDRKIPNPTVKSAFFGE